MYGAKTCSILYSKPFAFYCSYGGAGFITDKGFVGYQHGVKDLIFNTVKDNKSFGR